MQKANEIMVLERTLGIKDLHEYTIATYCLHEYLTITLSILFKQNWYIDADMKNKAPF